jgi:TonB family protein
MRMLYSPVAVLVVLAAISFLSIVGLMELKAASLQVNYEEGVTALMRAARDGERKNAKALIEQGVDVNAHDTYGWTALIYAAAKGDLEIVKDLLSKDADINARDQAGYTPLMAAAVYKNLPVVKILIEKGADVDQLDKSGASAMSFAIRGHQSKMVETLKKAGAVEPQAQQTGDPSQPRDTIDSRPVLINNPQPSYTTKARSEGIEGRVRLRVLVGSDGTVKRVRLMTGLPCGLSYQAMDAANQMIFKPARKNGEPVAYWVPVEIEFQLRRG